MEGGAVVNVIMAVWRSLVLLVRYGTTHVMAPDLVPVGAMADVLGLDKSPDGPRYISFSQRPMHGDMDVFGIAVDEVFHFCSGGIRELVSLLWRSPERGWRISKATVIYATVID